jgi:serine/threonine protein kinase
LSKKQEEKKEEPSKKKKKHKVLGTADYIAPEILKGEEHTFRLDFWSLGVIVYEFLTGALPFNDETPEKIFKNILARKITYPPIGTEEGMISPAAHKFMEELMCEDPSKRLGSNGIDEIKNHDFFKDMDWNTLMEGPAPFIPLGRDVDTVYFPKANDKDDDIRHIIDDQMKYSSIKVDKDF